MRRAKRRSAALRRLAGVPLFSQTIHLRALQSTDIVAIEADRDTEEKCRTIHIFAEGNFVRAYEWSAWLLSVCGPGMKVSLQSKKGVVKLLAVGFPINSESSWAKFTPAGASRAKSSDGGHDVLLLPAGAFSMATPQKLADDFARWRAEQEASLRPDSDKTAADKAVEAKGAKAQLLPLAPHPDPAPTTVAALLRSLCKVDVDELSPRECQALLRKFQCDYRLLLGF